MRHRRLRVAILVAFAAAAGHMAWQAAAAPTAPFDPVFTGEFPALIHPDADARQLYLRKTLYVTQRPRAAWLRVVAHDRVRLVMNGRLVETQSLDGFDATITVDLAPYFALGKNVVAIHAKQTRMRGRPAVFVEGAYTLSDGEHRIDGRDWNCGRTFDRHADWWFGHEFDERSWPEPATAAETFVARPPRLPESVTAADRGEWIADPAGGGQQGVAFRGALDVAGRPAAAWLRVTATGPYRLAINGTVVDQQAAGVAMQQPVAPVRRNYDVTSHVGRGHNDVSVLLGAGSVEPRLHIDGGATDGTESLGTVATGAGWQSRVGTAPDWLDADSAEGWRPCIAGGGDAGVPPYGPARQDIADAVPRDTSLRRLAGELLAMLGMGIAARYACRSADRFVGPGAALALVVPTVALAALALAAFDPRFPRQDVYRVSWLVLALLAVPLQWWALWRWNRPASPPPPLAEAARTSLPFGSRLDGKVAVRVLLGLAVVIGFALRARDMTTEPLQWDEVENYNATMATLKYGFPMLEVHPDLPRLVIHTSEFQFAFHALVAAVIHDPQWVVRVPAVLFGTATILLVFAVGRGMFGLATGLTAAWLYALASGYVPMATVGRYFSQLQFFCVLLVYLAWRLASGPDRLDTRRLWAAAAAFLAMFFTWEGSALVAPAIGAAMVFTYRGRLRTVALDRRVWAVFGVILLAYMLQRANHSLAQTRFLWIGISLSDVRLLPMWDYQSFLPWYYLWESSWSQDTLFPLLGLGGGLLAAVGRGGRPFRFLLWVYVPTCLAMAFLLPNYQFRYIYHVSPLLLLLAAAALCRLASAVARIAMSPSPREGVGGVQGEPGGVGRRRSARFYGRAVAAGTVAAGVLLGCGQLLDARYLTRLRVDGMTTGLFKYPDLGGPARFVKARMRPDDIIISNNSFQTNHLMGILGQTGQANNYIPMTGRLFLPATFPDHSAVLIDRRDGVRVIASPEDFKEVVARHPRVWYIAQPGQHYAQNTPTVSDYAVEHFEVVYEDNDALVLFHGAYNQPAMARQKKLKELSETGWKILD